MLSGHSVNQTTFINAMFISILYTYCSSPRKHPLIPPLLSSLGRKTLPHFYSFTSPDARKAYGHLSPLTAVSPCWRNIAETALLKRVCQWLGGRGTLSSSLGSTKPNNEFSLSSGFIQYCYMPSCAHLRNAGANSGGRGIRVPGGSTQVILSREGHA